MSGALLSIKMQCASLMLFYLAYSRLVAVHRLMYGEQARFFQDEVRQDLKHKKKGMVAMASASGRLHECLQHVVVGFAYMLCTQHAC